MIRLFSFSILFACWGLASAQWDIRMVFSTSGDQQTFPAVHYGYTFGEPIVGTTVGGLSILTMGFHQPEGNALLALPDLSLRGEWTSPFPSLSWEVSDPRQVRYFEVEVEIETSWYVKQNITPLGVSASFSTVDSILDSSGGPIHYRIRAHLANGASILSNSIFLSPPALGLGLRIFPNPVDTELAIELSLPDQNPHSVLRFQCINASGQQIWAKRVKGVGETTELRLETQDWPEGWYVLRMNAEGSHLAESFMVVHP